LLVLTLHFGNKYCSSEDSTIRQTAGGPSSRREMILAAPVLHTLKKKRRKKIW